MLSGCLNSFWQLWIKLKILGFVNCLCHGSKEGSKHSFWYCFSSLLAFGAALALRRLTLGCWSHDGLWQVESHSDCFTSTNQEAVGCPSGIFYAKRKGSAGCVVMLKKSFACLVLGKERLWVRRPGFESWLHQQLVLCTWTNCLNSGDLCFQVCKAILSSKDCSERQLP